MILSLYSISATTRTQRPGEEEGVQYYFLDKTRFESMIAEDGLLALDDPAAGYVPWLPPEITIEHLLNHTSGHFATLNTAAMRLARIGEVDVPDGGVVAEASRAAIAQQAEGTARRFGLHETGLLLRDLEDGCAFGCVWCRATSFMVGGTGDSLV